jgi:hypothetical protein
MVGNEAEVTRIEVMVNASSGIGENERLDAQSGKKMHVKCDRLRRVSFVEMHTPFDKHEQFACVTAQNHFAMMTSNTRHRIVWNVFGIKRQMHINMLGKIAETRAQHDSKVGRTRNFFS